MNYLAHLYLSGNDHDIMIGNFIADHLKGSTKHILPAGIMKGVELHHMIDAFTDNHPKVEESKARLRPHFRKYAPVIVDLYYDHFLARDWDKYHGQPLDQYAAEVYAIMHANEVLPERARYMLKYMSEQNWLFNYRSTEGIGRALNGLSRRSKFENNMHEAADFLMQDYDAFEKEFEVFFADLRLFVSVISESEYKKY